ncbi:hypothetical protein SVIO_109950 [Streptomyces violaceusniger]|uniref:Uncharacterized protein n=1 Tax=Streptomyces violaceusniger TaxID=68280 RepID=A0A4D4LGE6_STRVO|nr:hypothetical protein SVIO_109950 [Streptomyces violaceusniger]
MSQRTARIGTFADAPSPSTVTPTRKYAYVVETPMTSRPHEERRRQHEDLAALKAVRERAAEHGGGKPPDRGREGSVEDE